jgi:MscS family membrane protein
MNLRSALLFLVFTLLLSVRALAQDAAQAVPATDAAAQQQANTTAAAAVATGHGAPHTPDFLEHLVDSVLEIFDVRSSGNTVTHYSIAVLILLIAYVLRRVVTTLIFGFFKRLAARTETTLDDKLFPALESPVAALIVVIGAVASLKVLKLSASADDILGYAYTIAFSLVIFWGFLRAFDTVLDHMHEIARDKQLGLAPFMPWIKKSLLTIVFVFGVLMIAQSLGADVKAFLAGLGIGGLAFALAAQDTIANLFKIGETVRIGANVGLVEDIGLRSTKLRLPDKSLVIVPNKTVAAEPITNLSRFTARRVEQIIGLTYDATPDQLAAIVGDIRRIIEAEPEVNVPDTHVWFRDYSASSLDIWIVYVTKDPDFAKHMALRQRINLAIMRAVEARGLSFAFPTQTLHVASTPAGGAPAPIPGKS